MNGMSIFTSAVVFLAGVLVVRGEVFDCANYNPNICTMDNIPFCLTNGTIVSGRCYAQRAVCLEKATIDETFTKCAQKSQSNFDCSQYNPMICARDAIPFCLHNGTILRGSCFAKRAVCQEGQTVDDDFSACNEAGTKETRARSNMDPSSESLDDNDNAAASVSAPISLLLVLLFTALL